MPENEHFRHWMRWGILSIFWTFQAAGRAPSTSFLFIITNYQFVIFHITIQFAQQSPQKLPFSNPYQTFLISILSHQNHNSNYPIILSLPRGTLFTAKNIPKCTPIPSPIYTYKSLIFPLKIPKSGLKSLFFNR